MGSSYTRCEKRVIGETMERMVITRFSGALLFLCLIFFLSAGTVWYWQAWVYLAILFVPVTFVAAYLFKHSPDLLERRMRTKEKEPRQNLIIRLGLIFFLITFAVPGLDRRFGWTSVPPSVVVLGDVMVIAGYALVAWVFKENRYASRIIEVEKGQTVVTTGPYRIVRHPMYLGTILMYGFTSLALGSYWALIPAVGLMVPVLVARIKNEEEVLARELKGYREYMARTRYRLIPGIW